MTIDLSQLPPPDAVEPLDYESIYQSVLADFSVLYPNAVGDLLESDPATKLLELAAYREMGIRARINAAARARLLAFSAGGDLDHKAAEWDLERLPGEPDHRLRLRVQLRIQAMAGNGTAEQYRGTALGVSLEVVDAAVTRPQRGQVGVAVWVAEGADSAAVLDAVRAAFAGDAQILGVPMVVSQARPHPVDLVATLYREASAPVDLVAQLQAALPARITSHAQLGRDIARSWLLSALHTTGISRVDLASPASDRLLAADEYAVPGSIALADGGVAW